MDTEVTGLSPRPASSISCASPTRLGWARAASPVWTMVRFSPVMGITSATVPTAARSAYSRNTRPARSGPAAAMASFRATPTPASPLKG